MIAAAGNVAGSVGAIGRAIAHCGCSKRIGVTAKRNLIPRERGREIAGSRYRSTRPEPGKHGSRRDQTEDRATSWRHSRLPPRSLCIIAQGRASPHLSARKNLIRIIRTACPRRKSFLPRMTLFLVQRERER